jgi:hypothetical protein
VGLCVDTSCGKKALGASCSGGAECATGHCVDGTCCSTSACATCQSCANPQGTCQNVPNDMPDPDSCTDQTSTDPCGLTGKCNGMGQCKLAAAGTSCGKVCTANNTAVVTKVCDGNGSCGGMSTVTTCNGFRCKDGVCLTTCEAGSNDGCVSGKICVANQCQDTLPE